MPSILRWTRPVVYPRASGPVGSVPERVVWPGDRDRGLVILILVLVLQLASLGASTATGTSVLTDG